MLIKRSVFAAVLFAAVCASTAFGQSDTGRFVRSRFVSFDGGFTVDLPSRTDNSIERVGSIFSGASTFSWRYDKGNFTIGYVDDIPAIPGNGFRPLNDLADTVAATLAKTGGKVVDRCPFSFNGYPGIELRIDRRAGSGSINRFILVGHRLYILTADWPLEGSEAASRQVLDSFDLIDTKALVA